MLENALDYDISEADFWSMTFAELNRLVTSKQRVAKMKAQEKASYDYLLAALIGRAYAASMSSSIEFPAIEEAYPSVFDVEQKRQEKQERINQLSALRFKQFAQSYNTKFKEVANDK
jgi:hypothetical protein